MKFIAPSAVVLAGFILMAGASEAICTDMELLKIAMYFMSGLALFGIGMTWFQFLYNLDRIRRSKRRRHAAEMKKSA